MITMADGLPPFANLPDGTCRTSADLNGSAKTRTVSVSAGRPERLAFVWY